MANKDGRMSGNKGEWSELYAFMKLLSQGRVYAANEKVEKIAEVYYPILKIMREETKGEVVDYVIHDNQICVEIQSNKIISVDRTEMENQANKLIKEIASHSGSFELEEIAKFANGIKVTKIKAPSTDTTDISMQIEDIHTNFIRNVGFSIKSEVGNPPTLLNAGLTTNFIYKVTGITMEQAEEINAIETRTKIKDKMSKIAEYGGKIQYCGMNHDGFKRNLIMVDSSMPEIIGNMLLYFYTEDVKDCDNLVDMLGDRDPLGYGDPMMYTYKFKKFLCSCALGMKPAKPWNGLDEANGGYIIVKADGEILAYHIYNRNFFEQYLLDNTYLDRPMNVTHEELENIEKNLNEMYVDKRQISKFYSTDFIYTIADEVEEKINNLKENTGKLRGLFIQHEKKMDELITKRKDDINQFFLNYMINNTCFFIGLSMTDPNMRRLLEIAAQKRTENDGECQHYAIMRRFKIKDSEEVESIKSFERVNESLQESFFKELGVNVLWIDEFSEIPILLKQIKGNYDSY